MGQLVFDVGAHLRGWIAKGAAQLLTCDRRQIPLELQVRDERLVAMVPDRESGSLHLAIELPELGHCVVSTSSLMPRSRPYRLGAELARGALSKAHDAWAELSHSEWSPDGTLAERLRQAQKELRRAVTAVDLNESDQIASAALVAAIAIGEELTAQAHQSLLEWIRHERAPRLSLGAAAFGDFNPTAVPAHFISLPVDWRTIEPSEGTFDWAALDVRVARARDAGLPIALGPVLDFRDGKQPDWVARSLNDRSVRQSVLANRMESCVGRYRADAQVFDVATGIDTSTRFPNRLDQRIETVGNLVDVVRRLHANAEVVLTISQPFGDSSGGERLTIGPIDFVDCVLRSGVGLTALALEVAVGYCAGARPRSVLDFRRLLWDYAGLGLPLWVRFVFPSESGPGRVERYLGHQLDESLQCAILDRWLIVAAECPAVSRIIWQGIRDGVSPWPAGGLRDHEGRGKPALERWNVFWDAAAHGQCLRR